MCALCRLVIFSLPKLHLLTYGDLWLTTLRPAPPALYVVICGLWSDRLYRSALQNTADTWPQNVKSQHGGIIVCWKNPTKYISSCRLCFTRMFNLYVLWWFIGEKIPEICQSFAQKLTTSRHICCSIGDKVRVYKT